MGILVEIDPCGERLTGGEEDGFGAAAVFARMILEVIDMGPCCGIGDTVEFAVDEVALAGAVEQAGIAIEDEGKGDAGMGGPHEFGAVEQGVILATPLEGAVDKEPVARCGLLGWGSVHGAAEMEAPGQDYEK